MQRSRLSSAGGVRGAGRRRRRRVSEDGAPAAHARMELRRREHVLGIGGSMTALLALARCGLRVRDRRDALDAYLASAPAGDDSAERLRRREVGRGVGAEELEALNRARVCAAAAAPGREPQGGGGVSIAEWRRMEF